MDLSKYLQILHLFKMFCSGQEKGLWLCSGKYVIRSKGKRYSKDKILQIHIILNFWTLRKHSKFASVCRHLCLKLLYHSIKRQIENAYHINIFLIIIWNIIKNYTNLLLLLLLFLWCWWLFYFIYGRIKVKTY